MDFSPLEALLALREELREHTADPSAPTDKAAALARRVVQHRERTLELIAKAKAKPPRIDEVFRAAAADLPPLPAEHVKPSLSAGAPRASKVKKAKAAKTSRKVTK